MNAVLPVERGSVRSELRLRVVAKTEAETAQLLLASAFRFPADPR